MHTNPSKQDSSDTLLTHYSGIQLSLAGTSRQIGSVTLQVTSLDAAVSMVRQSIESRSGDLYAFCNIHSAGLAYKSANFAAALSKMTVFNDGIGLNIASQLLYGISFSENLNGTDFTPILLGKLPPTRVFLLGSPPGVASCAAGVLQDRFPHLLMVGTGDGFFLPEQSGSIARQIREKQPDLVLVGMGNPRQEIWAAEWGRMTGAVVLCVGAFLDFTAGAFSRAPRWVRALHCEWLYRLALEPRRLFWRYFINAPAFLLAIVRQRLRSSGG